MSISGKFSIDVHFIDKTADVGSSSTKTLFIQDVGDYSTGKVAIISGTVGTAVETISISPSPYIDSSGAAVSFGSVSRVAVIATRAIVVKNDADMAVISDSTLASVSDAQNTTAPLQLHPTYASGTAEYTLLIYGT